MIPHIKKSTYEKKEVARLATLAIILIPLSTYRLGFEASPLYYSLSMIGNQLGYRFRFILWGITTGALLTFFITRLFVLNSFKDPRARRLLVSSAIFLVLTVLIPFMDRFRILSKLHNLTAFAFGLSLIASLYLFLKFLSTHNHSVYEWSVRRFVLIVGGSAALYFIYGATGIFELFFFISLSLFLGILDRKLD